MPTLFFKDFWHIVGREVTHFMLNVLNDGVSPKSVNQSLIALIPKVKTRTDATQFRTMALYNVIYKLISKTHANHLKECLADIVHETQSAFVPVV